MKVSVMKLLQGLLLVIGGALVISSSSFAHGGVEHEDNEGTFKAEQCAEPDEDVMRRNHMVYIKHQRDETMHNGIRTSKYSLKGCIDCHEKKDDDGKPMTVDNPEHFCASCHIKAAVTLDCFECHRSTPDAAATKELKRTGASFLLKTEGAK